MEKELFDALTRTLTCVGSTRRRTLQVMGSLLCGALLARVPARIGLVDSAEAKAKKHRERQTQRQTSNALHAAGRKHKKHRNKRRDKPKDPPPLPPGCQHCNECQMCQDGACVPDPALGGVPCVESGATCSYCLNGACAATEIRPCDDGICAHRGACCPGEKRCSDLSFPEGYYCIDATGCCDGQKTCGARCISSSSCCDEERPQCGPCDEVVCTNGHYQCVTRCCAGEKPCPGGGCVAQGECCPGANPPPPRQCCEAVCANGELMCQFNMDSCPPCRDAGTVSCPGMQWLVGQCCPENLFFHSQGRPVCDWGNPNGGPLIFCDSPTGH